MTYPLSFVTKRGGGGSFRYKSSYVLRGRVSIGLFDRGSVSFL